ncbi:hypothetical protein D3C76_1515100 [compost metagenome]
MSRDIAFNIKRGRATANQLDEAAPIQIQIPLYDIGLARRQRHHATILYCQVFHHIGGVAVREADIARPIGVGRTIYGQVAQIPAIAAG